ncbi:MAG TPA: helix-turn-helix domain-containing protein [Candidatus Limnocylindrales bacterium]|nr:helix-turn-helix domain-containing protein [Candidatus Limnocylindrales bacterium]
MDDLRIGAVARTARHRLPMRQADIAARAGRSQQLVSLFEHGGLAAVDREAARRICAALEMRLDVVPRWRGSDLDRLLDEAHAGLVNEAVRRLRDAGWEPLVEWSFSHFGERGSVDVVGWRAKTRQLLVIEVKSRIVDTQELLAALDRKVRLARALLPAERAERTDTRAALPPGYQRAWWYGPGVPSGSPSMIAAGHYHQGGWCFPAFSHRKTAQYQPGW